MANNRPQTVEVSPTDLGYDARSDFDYPITVVRSFADMGGDGIEIRLRNGKIIVVSPDPCDPEVVMLVIMQQAEWDGSANPTEFPSTTITVRDWCDEIVTRHGTAK